MSVFLLESLSQMMFLDSAGEAHRLVRCCSYLCTGTRNDNSPEKQANGTPTYAGWMDGWIDESYVKESFREKYPDSSAKVP
jgi:hypothetical protein